MTADSSDGSDGRTVVVDGNNVMGSVPDGWWRDRPAAARRLLARLACYVRATGGAVVLVLDVPQPDLPTGDHDGVLVRYPDRPGRDGADGRIVALLDEAPGVVAEVVTSDRALAELVARRGVAVTGARTFLGRLDQQGC